MTRFVLDTDTITLFDRKQLRVVANVAANAALVAVTTISVEEQIGGWFGQLKRAITPSDHSRISRNIAATVELLGSFTILHMTEPAIARFESLLKLKLNVGRMDLRIASIALEANATIVTRNLRDFGRVPGLTVADWSV